MLIKYKVSEVAKDFGLDTKSVLAILKEHLKFTKTGVAALSEDELNVVFDVLTQQTELENFDDYFAMGESAREKLKKEREEKRQSKLNEQALIAEQLKAAAKDFKNAPPAVEAKPKGETPDRSERKTRTVDMSASQVNLDKYNEKYDTIAAPTNHRFANAGGKQKFTKRPQRGKPLGKKFETEADKLRRIQLERIKQTPIKVQIPDEISVGELATRMKKTAAEIVKQLMKLGVMASVSDVIDFDTAELIATELGAKVEREIIVTIEEQVIDDTSDDAANLQARAPIVVVMGHVDHGKTSLLDAIRHSEVTSTEAGGITQHIGAYQVNHDGLPLTFLDTPGHEAFTSMRQRGANITDIAVLVVAADDGIMPQTIEAIRHAKAANVQIIVAINKIDKPEANPDKVMQQLTEHELVPEEWGGDIMCIPVSAHTKQGLDKLLESILLVAEVLELKANPNRRAHGTVIEARLDKGRGVVATMLVQNGTLNAGDIVVAGSSIGRVRAMVNDKGEEIKSAAPAVPVEIIGLAEVPLAGDAFDAVADERLANKLVDQRRHQAKEAVWGARAQVTLENLFSHIEQGEMKTLNIIVKADVQGSAEAVKQSLEKITNEEVRVSVIHAGVGAVSESDVMLASTSGAIVVGFNVRPHPAAAQNAAAAGVDIRMYRVIYTCIDEITQAMKGMLAPKYREVQLGRIEVREVYKISNIGTVAGSYVTDGKVTRNAESRVLRDGIVITENKIDSLRRFKDDAKEVAQGYECGIGLEKFDDIKEGDIFEAFIMEEYRD